MKRGEYQAYNAMHHNTNNGNTQMAVIPGLYQETHNFAKATKKLILELIKNVLFPLRLVAKYCPILWISDSRFRFAHFHFEKGSVIDPKIMTTSTVLEERINL